MTWTKAPHQECIKRVSSRCDYRTEGEGLGGISLSKVPVNLTLSAATSIFTGFLSLLIILVLPHCRYCVAGSEDLMPTATVFFFCHNRLQGPGQTFVHWLYLQIEQSCLNQVIALLALKLKEKLTLIGPRWKHVKHCRTSCLAFKVCVTKHGCSYWVVHIETSVSILKPMAELNSFSWFLYFSQLLMLLTTCGVGVRNRQIGRHFHFWFCN